MKERPILFSGPMVRAILAGTKTQTRRVVKPQPVNLAGPNFDGLWSDTIDPVVRYFACPYGQPGDRLWVKETFTLTQHNKPVYRADARDADGDRWPSIVPGDPNKEVRWKPSIFCRREYSRITLEVVSVRVERLNEISEADARAEGVAIDRGHCYGVAGHEDEWAHATARGCFNSIWNSINGAQAFEENPWVWVVEFRRAA